MGRDKIHILRFLRTSGEHNHKYKIINIKHLIFFTVGAKGMRNSRVNKKGYLIIFYLTDNMNEMTSNM